LWLALTAQVLYRGCLEEPFVSITMLWGLLTMAEAGKTASGRAGRAGAGVGTGDDMEVGVKNSKDEIRNSSFAVIVRKNWTIRGVWAALLISKGLSYGF